MLNEIRKKRESRRVRRLLNQYERGDYMSETKELVTTTDDRQLAVFSSGNGFETAQRMAKALASSDLVPKEYKGNIANCLVALEISQRTRSSALAVMQNLNIIHGKPSWSSSYIIAALNSCGRFSPVKFRIEGEGDKLTCIAYAKDSDGELIEGPPVSIAMAKAEGWYDKAGSKWKTLPLLMIRYRAAAFFGRLYAPDVLMGMSSEDELRDVTPVDTATGPTSDVVGSLNSKIGKTDGAKKAVKKPTVINAQAVNVVDVPPAEPEPEATPVDSGEPTKSESEIF
jgi:hypothetical protein